MDRQQAETNVYHDHETFFKNNEVSSEPASPGSSQLHTSYCLIQISSFSGLQEGNSPV